MILQPEATWETCMKPPREASVGERGQSCQARHVGCVDEGTLQITSDDGSKTTLGTGEAVNMSLVHHAPRQKTNDDFLYTRTST